LNKKCVIGKTIDEIKVGDKAYFAKTISESDIVQYSGITGDVNPIAVDATFASKTRYKKRVAHGMLIASFFSNIIGTKLPGPGSIHVSYKVKFTKPVFIGDTVETKVEIVAVDKNNNTVDVLVESINQEGVVVLTGSGVVSPPLAAYCN
jgi:3-hydroxybutyryl-CoA dehydratase